MEAFAHEATLHVGEGGDYGVDLSAGDFFFERFQCQITRHGKIQCFG